MQLLCLGDVAFTDKPLVPAIYGVPAGLTPSVDTQVMFNWEFPIGRTINPKPRVRGKRFLTSLHSVNMVKNWAPGIATIATNHILDASEEGLSNTINSLQQAGFKTVGAGMSFEQIVRPVFWETEQGRLAIINWVFAEAHPDWMVVPGPNCWPGFEEATITIQTLKRTSDWVMVVVHWSDELFPYPLPQDRSIAYELATIGADIIVGHHPHVVRGMEVIGHCPVFYSLGNFYFPLQDAPRNREGLGVRVTFRQGQNPAYELLSFWNTRQNVAHDRARRACRRLILVSKALQRYQGDNYINWYKKTRARFDKWDSRWHFGLMQRGIVGTLRRMVMRFQKLPLVLRS